MALLPLPIQQRIRKIKILGNYKPYYIKGTYNSNIQNYLELADLSISNSAEPVRRSIIF